MMTRRERVQEATRDEIKGIARQLLADEGAAALSLRAIARTMGMSAPGLYRYFPSRDDLITALVMDAFNALGDALDSTHQEYNSAPVAEQVFALCIAYRDWALANARDYSLIFGDPIPGYHAPADLTRPTVRRAFRAFLLVAQRAWDEGALSTNQPQEGTAPQLEAHLREWQQQTNMHVPPAVFQRALSIWCFIHGMITLELFNHLQPILGDTHSFYTTQVRAFLTHLGMSTVVGESDAPE